MKENYAVVDGRKNIGQLTKQQQYSNSPPLSKLLRAQHFTISPLQTRILRGAQFVVSFWKLIRVYYVSTKVKPGSFTELLRTCTGENSVRKTITIAELFLHFSTAFRVTRV